MSHPNNNPTPPRDASAQLAHELANLLDGSLRHLGIAIDTLSQTQQPDDPSTQKNTTDDGNLLGRLQTTDLAMRQMASLIKAWMKSAPRPNELFDQTQTLKQTLEQVIDIHRPTAARHGIDIELSVDPAAAGLPAGPVFPVAANALLNSIEAIAQMPGDDPTQHRIDVNVRLEAGQVWLMVSDNGPGIDPQMIDEQGELRIGHTTRPDGHGLGLMLSQQVAKSLDGKLTLAPQSTGGTRLTLRYPAKSVRPDTTSEPNLFNTQHQD